MGVAAGVLVAALPGAGSLIALAVGVAVGAGAVLLLRRREDPPAPAGDKVIEISQLAGGLAHEIRNPLSTLLLNLKLLEEDIDEEWDASSDACRRAKRKIALARAEADRLQRMLDEFLLLVTPVGLKRVPVDLNTVVDRLTEFYGPEAARNGCVLRGVRSPEPLVCLLDAQVFEQAVLNLLINAQQAIRDRGEIVLAVSRDGDFARLDVADNGEGMSPDVVAKAMQAFYSTKPNGSGLGLSTTSRIVSAHEGTLDVTSKPKVGSRFEIRLPLAPPSLDIPPFAVE